MNFIKRLYFSANSRLLVAKGKRVIESYYNKYQGKRCFIIGNGPSLRTEDLEKLNDEVTFASHGIYYLFHQTSWRPTYYCAQDSKYINEKYGEIKSECGDIQCFFGLVSGWQYPRISKKAGCVNLDVSPFENELPKFSEDLVQCAYEGFTVTYFIIQLAIYMGFREIYLLGVDHNYSITMNADGTIKVDKTAEDHFYKQDTLSNVPQTDKSTMAYCAARNYADQHNIKIYNATRGGKLDAFERVDFDHLFDS